ncbi:histidine kinase [Paenibacillus oenotherae]|uniref:Histidine kinase n=1 Tax=Paenibacillus oenotherae TaxID=1435645 RepID=A0ABS7D2B7_9BACL|nr:histidine kinase [Paenibacillus oenotherae]MBW7473994.1 histidine kinase [Paenibacillus oenotherae]
MLYKKSLFFKLLVDILIAVVLPFALSNLISYKMTSDSVEEQVIALNQNTMEIGMDNMKRYLTNLNRLSVAFYNDQTLMKYLRAKETAPFQMLYITDKVSNLYNSYSELKAVRYVSAGSGQTYLNSHSALLELSLKLSPSEIPKKEGENWDINRGYEVLMLGEERVLAFHKPLVDYPKPDVLGLVSLYAGQKEISEIIRPLSDGHRGEAVFLHIQKQFKLLYASSLEPAMEFDGPESQPEHWGARGYVNGQLDGRKGVFVYVQGQYQDLPLSLVKFVPADIINGAAERTLNFTLVLQLIALFFLILLASILSYRTIVPIKRLLRNIVQLESGNFRVRETSGRMDEIGVLEQRFQTMVGRLDDLINNEYRSRLELTTARLKMLQAQINPHFLYNTLQSIGTMALRHRADDISDKIADLGAIMRYSMDLKSETVRLQQEIEHIEHYLSLQTGRFKNKLSYTLSCPSEALSISVPKMILQPLVENSIIHGIEKGTGTGTLHISIELGRDLVIRVMDNGKGIEPEVLERIRLSYDKRQLQGPDEGGIGLLNVLHRLHLSYGPDFEWDISSMPYAATVITLRFPVEVSIAGGE